MSIATTTAIAISAAAAIGSAAIAAHSASSAASKQAGSAKSALQLQQMEWQQQQQNEAPFLQQGSTAVNNLSNLVNDPNFSKYPGGTFSAPTLAEAEQMPGYQFQLEQGTKAIDQNAAANGSLLSGNTGKALTDYGQGLASTGYGNLYNQALSTYMTNYGVWNADTTNQVNRLQNLSNMGANTAANLGTQGQAAAANAGTQLINQGTAQASGIVGAGNAISSGLTNATNQLPLYAMLAQQQNASSYQPLFPNSPSSSNPGAQAYPPETGTWPAG